MKQKIKLSTTFCNNYHMVFCILFLIIGYGSVMGFAIVDHGVSTGIMLGILTSVMGTLCFLLLPMFFITIGMFIKYLPTLAFPIFIILLIGKFFGETNLIDENGYGVTFIVSVLLTLFGTFNILTNIKARKDKDYDWMEENIHLY